MKSSLTFTFSLPHAHARSPRACADEYNPEKEKHLKDEDDDDDDKLVAEVVDSDGEDDLEGAVKRNDEKSVVVKAVKKVADEGKWAEEMPEIDVAALMAKRYYVPSEEHALPQKEGRHEE